jgi:ribosomal protein S18 acetylase RimI-like enzyme
MAPAGEVADLRFETNARLSVDEVNAAYAWAEWPQREGWRIEAASRRSNWISARTADGDLAGVVRVLDDGGLYASVWDLLVHPDWRRRGLGSRLAELALEVCHDRRLVVLVSTPMARSLLERLGLQTESHGHAAMYLRPYRS